MLLLFVLLVPEKPLPKAALLPFSLSSFLANFLINPLKHRDFGYVWVARALVILSQTVMAITALLGAVFIVPIKSVR